MKITDNNYSIFVIFRFLQIETNSQLIHNTLFTN